MSDVRCPQRYFIQVDIIPSTQVKEINIVNLKSKLEASKLAIEKVHINSFNGRETNAILN